MTLVLAATVGVLLEQAQAGAVERESREEADNYVNHTAF
jgi:hypothetical protein